MRMEPPPLVQAARPRSFTDGATQKAVPGLLLAFPAKEIEQDFRHFQGEHHYWHDVWWSLCITVIVVRGCCVEEQQHGWHLCATEVTVSAALLALQLGQKSAYLRHRSHILTATRLARLAAVLILFLLSAAAEDAVWPLLPDTASCTSSLLFSQLHKITFIISRSISLPVPLKHSIGIQALSLAVMLAFVPRRCASYLASKQFDGPEGCVIGAAGALRALAQSGAWVLNLALPEPPAVLDSAPLAACAAVQTALIVVVGFLAPLLIASSLEEHRRLEWAENDWGGSPLRPPLALRLVYDVIFMFIGALVAANAVQSFPWHLILA